MTSEQVLSLSVPILLAFLAGVGWMYRHEREKRDEIERKLSDTKFKVYNDLIDIFIGVLQEQKQKQKSTINERKIISTLQSAQRQLLMYGSDDVLGEFINFMEFCYAGNTDIHKMMKIYSNFLIAIRKDMGNKHSKIKNHDILRMLITDYQNIKVEK